MRVNYDLDNLNLCQCPNCPVHNTSPCITGKLQSTEMQPPFRIQPAPDNVEYTYCTDVVGKSQCDDLNASLSCVCGTCDVWKRNGLNMYKYCIDGSQMQREQQSKGGMGMRM